MFDLQARRTLGRLVDLKLLSFQILLLWHLSSRDRRLLRRDLPRLSQYIDLLSRYSQEIFFLKRAKPVTAPQRSRRDLAEISQRSRSQLPPIFCQFPAWGTSSIFSTSRMSGMSRYRTFTEPLGQVSVYHRIYSI